MKTKHLVLGTALWGWQVEKNDAFAILDHFVSCGGRFVDTASNYPINNNKDSFGLAVSWLKEWLAIYGRKIVRIILKVGAVDNSGGNESQLSGAFLDWAYGHYVNELGDALSVLSTHWDDSDDPAVIEDTVGAFREMYNRGMGIGLSGIKHPDLYRNLAPDCAERWWIQVKENFSTNAARMHCQPWFPDAKYFAYGINLGGVKTRGTRGGLSAQVRGITHSPEILDALEEAALRAAREHPYVDAIHKFTLFNACATDALAGVIVGPSTLEQMKEIMTFQREMAEHGRF